MKSKMKTGTLVLVIGVLIFLYLLYKSNPGGIFTKNNSAILPTNTQSGESQIDALIESGGEL